MQRTCARCSKPFQAKRSTARYCSGTCRTMASQERAGKAPPFAPLTPPVPGEGRNVRATRLTLEALDRVESSNGAFALTLAEQLDVGLSGSAWATVVKELRSTLEAAALGAKTLADPVDELTERRRARRGA